MTPQLLSQIHQLANLLPISVLESVVKRLISSEVRYCNAALKVTILKQLFNSNFRRAVADLLEVWQLEPMPLDAPTLAAALQTAAYCTIAAKAALSIELVWTGPDSFSIPLRRTDQVLLQLIREAQQELTIVSFAVYKIPAIAQALSSALNRGVALRIIAETPASSEGKIPFGVRTALGAKIIQQAQVLVWPLAKRPMDENGKYGSLHAKCAIADRKHLLISSANLTEYALSLNMEIGLLVHNDELANRVAEHIDALIQQEILQPG